jgi:hypothetical protein
MECYVSSVHHCLCHNLGLKLVNLAPPTPKVNFNEHHTFVELSLYDTTRTAVLGINVPQTERHFLGHVVIPLMDVHPIEVGDQGWDSPNCYWDFIRILSPVPTTCLFSRV